MSGLDKRALFSLIVCCRCHTAVLATQNMFCCPFGPHADSLFRLKVCHSLPLTHTMFEFVGDSLGQPSCNLLLSVHWGNCRCFSAFNPVKPDVLNNSNNKIYIYIFKLEQFIEPIDKIIKKDLKYTYTKFIYKNNVFYGLYHI